ncbi:protein phosphatase 2C domain-containing protein [uncultured Amphritea sp.]|uniref:PP2C family protein-serine/threonine phosphatase n=1 Tax=uncultured Amphritea sp. TaxID=981605 RepID=UPI00262DD679|nr:protein phosphatase 2C domain-containing protein [uncultured Amphritea sp.]
MSVETLLASSRYISSALTSVGNVRKHNEDAFLSQPEQAHWVVADGMGGHSAGDFASQSIVDALQMFEQQPQVSDSVDLLEDILLQTNHKLLELAGDDHKIIGSTVAGLVLLADYYLLYWCGDSRIYLYRNGVLMQESVDHTYTQGLVAQGRLTPEEALIHPERNVITRAVGAADALYIDMDIRNLQSGDRFLICSDGLDKELSDADIAAFLAQRHIPLEQLAQEMMDCCLERGGRDNITLILIENPAAA